MWNGDCLPLLINNLLHSLINRLIFSSTLSKSSISLIISHPISEFCFLKNAWNIAHNVCRQLQSLFGLSAETVVIRINWDSIRIK